MQRHNQENLSVFAGFLQRGIFFVVISVLILFLNSCASSKSTIRTQEEIPLDRTSFSFSEDAHPYDLFTEYRIVPGDLLDILFQFSTWLKREDFKLEIDHTIQIRFIHAPELDVEQRARPDGYITLHYVGDVYVVDKTVKELKQEILEKYKDILQIPEITVLVPEFRANIKELKSDLKTAPRGLSRLTTVRPDGYVTFPLIGDIFVAGRTIPEVNKELNEKYGKIMPGLHCDLFLEKHAGSTIYVLGEVNKPGIYDIPRPVSVVEALALAGSFKPGAKLNSIFIVRKHMKKLIATRVDLSKTLAFDRNSKFFYLMANDIVYVPKRWIYEAADLASQIASLLFFKGWSISYGIGESVDLIPP